MKPFDAHNHVHMGPTAPVQSLLTTTTTANVGASEISNTNEARITSSGMSGMAIMSTHPRDYDRVLGLSKTLPTKVEGKVQIVPCFGVHPWFLHELSDSDWETTTITSPEDLQQQTTNDDEAGTLIPSRATSPRWIQNLENLVKANPNAIVGEIGLDGFHFDPQTEDLVSPMDQQVEAFRLQMELAARLQRPVSIHTVQCMGQLFDPLNRIKKDARKARRKPALPPKMYFHAFGGKPATIDQLVSICGKGQVYFGFAPIINFRSPKTADVIRKVGIERLVLETDHEDAARVPNSMEQCIKLMAEALEMEEDEVVEQTTKNAFDLYGLNNLN